jgi:hypothetical protein
VFTALTHFVLDLRFIAFQKNVLAFGRNRSCAVNIGYWPAIPDFRTARADSAAPVYSFLSSMAGMVGKPFLWHLME